MARTIFKGFLQDRKLHLRFNLIISSGFFTVPAAPHAAIKICKMFKINCLF